MHPSVNELGAREVARRRGGKDLSDAATFPFDDRRPIVGSKALGDLVQALVDGRLGMFYALELGQRDTAQTAGALDEQVGRSEANLNLLAHSQRVGTKISVHERVGD